MGDFSSSCVVDTSVIIDVYIGKIMVEFFRLPYRFYAPDVIIAELEEPDGEILIEFGLIQKELTSNQILEVMQLRQKYRGPSANDLFALVTAQLFKAILLTSDRSLYKAAKQEKIVTHGILWILDEMVKLNVISCQKAKGALHLMRLNGSYLPQQECEKRIRDWDQCL